MHQAIASSLIAIRMDTVTSYMTTSNGIPNRCRDSIVFDSGYKVVISFYASAIFFIISDVS